MFSVSYMARICAYNTVGGKAAWEKLLSLHQEKAGVGKTTTTANIESVCPDSGQKVMVIDTDLD